MTRGHVKEEINILGATLLESPRGPLLVTFQDRQTRDTMHARTV